jgi:periplasmic copper chaperone A
MRASAFAVVLMSLTAAVPTTAHEITRDGVQISHPWVRETPKGTGTAAGYAKITNSGKEPERLIGASINGAASAELQSTIVENGVGEMSQQAGGIAISPGETIELRPGSLHIMFLGLTTSLDADQYVDGTLIFEKAGTIAMEYFVEPLAGGESGKTQHHH